MLYINMILLFYKECRLKHKYIDIAILQRMPIKTQIYEIKNYYNKC